MISVWKPNSFIFSIFMMLFVFDLFLLGGGRVIEVFTITLRMILFSIALLLAVIVLVRSNQINHTTIWSLLIFIVIILYSSFISSMYGNFSFGSTSGYLFVLLVMFFYCFRDRAYYFFENTIAFSSILMSVIYLSFLILVFLGKISFLDVYNYIPESELFLRGQEGFVYKGFIYILVGALYFVIVDRYKPIWRFLFFLVCLIAIIATLTRGFMLSLLLVISIYYIFELKSVVSKTLIIVFFCFLPVFAFMFFPEIIFREGSDSTRINDINEFLIFIDTGGINLIFGNGISSYLGERPAVENAYMDMWFRFGLVGLFLLLLCFVKISLDYFSIKKIRENNRCFDWLYYSVVLIFIQSNFNPYVNNYIGGSFLMFVLVYFDSVRAKSSPISSNKLVLGI